MHVWLVGKPEGKIERDRELVVRIGDTGGACRVGGKPEGKRERERELVVHMGDTGGACRVGGET